MIYKTPLTDFVTLVNEKKLNEENTLRLRQINYFIFLKYGPKN